MDATIPQSPTVTAPFAQGGLSLRHAFSVYSLLVRAPLKPPLCKWELLSLREQREYATRPLVLSVCEAEGLFPGVILSEGRSP